jgi:enoyl-CoA hydratase/carnithine racemase
VLNMTGDPFRAVQVDRVGPVATVRIRPVRLAFAESPPAEVHAEVGRAMVQLRDDDSVRLVVLTGDVDGEYVVPPPTSQYRTSLQGDRLSADETEWLRGTGVIRAHQAIAEMEKPVVARVNGDAMGFGSSLMFNCDIIVAREDAKVCDMHLGLGTVVPSGRTEPVGPHFNMYPGDGGASLAPLYLTPALAKEYLFLAREYQAGDMARLGLINYAVPMSELDAVTDRLVARLLERDPEVIAYTKRVANRALVAQLNLTLDAGVAYEHVSIRKYTSSLAQENA